MNTDAIAEPESTRFRFIPFRRHEVASFVAAEHQKRGGDPDQLCELTRVLSSVLHYEFHDELESLKEWYAPFDPDMPHVGESLGPEELSHRARALAEGLSDILERGNYHRLTERDVDDAKDRGSLIELRVEVDFDEFEELVLYSRGERVARIEKRVWWSRKPKIIDAPVFDRVCMYVRFLPAHKRRRRRTGLSYEPGTTMLKLFRNIPMADLEMLLPNCYVRMRLRDKLMLGVPAVVGGVPVMLKLWPAVVALGILLGLTTGHVSAVSLVPGLMAFLVLGLFLFRQWDKFRSRKVLFLKVLTENLYFRNLDNNEGVLTRLVDEAEEEEAKEAILAYATLLWSKEPLSAAEIDGRIEAWFREDHGVSFDFEIEDAMRKLGEFGLADFRPDGRATAVTPETALDALDRRWDAYFSGGTSAQSPTPSGDAPVSAD